MNKTLAFILIAALAVVGLAGVVVLLILRPEAVDTLTNLLMQLLIMLGGFGGLAAIQSRQGEEIKTIKHNTNGTLTAKEDEIAKLRATLAEHAPQALANVETGSVPTATRAQLREDSKPGY